MDSPNRQCAPKIKCHSYRVNKNCVPQLYVYRCECTTTAVYIYRCEFTTTTKPSPPLPVRTANITAVDDLLNNSSQDTHLYCTQRRYAGVRRRVVKYLKIKKRVKILVNINPQGMSTEQHRHNKLNIDQNCGTAREHPIFEEVESKNSRVRQKYITQHLCILVFAS